MARQVVKAKTPTSAIGEYSPTYLMLRFKKGFSLLELLVVAAIVATATSGVAFALQDASRARLYGEAQRLAALLESGRFQSRATGVTLRWSPTPQGFLFYGFPLDTVSLPSTWANIETQAHSIAPILLGPDPVIGAQGIRLWMRDDPSVSLWVITDGVGPFIVGNKVP
ncbi:Prokaryotic N-terminal methylation site [Comamonadaceae bacterium]|jgi:general secretion pathway protein H